MLVGYSGAAQQDRAGGSRFQSAHPVVAMDHLRSDLARRQIMTLDRDL